jgi:hypothetical protein
VVVTAADTSHFLISPTISPPRLELDTCLSHGCPLQFNVAYIIFFIMGAGFLFSWNSFITAADYFGSLYPDAHVE